MLRQVELHGAASINEQVSAEVTMRAIDLHFAEGLLFIGVLHNGYACSIMRTDDEKGLKGHRLHQIYSDTISVGWGRNKSPYSSQVIKLHRTCSEAL